MKVTARTVWGSNPGKNKIYATSPKRSDRLWGPPSLLFSGYREFIFPPGIKRPGCEFNHSAPSSAEVKNDYRHTATAPYTYALCELNEEFNVRIEKGTLTGKFSGGSNVYHTPLPDKT